MLHSVLLCKVCRICAIIARNFSIAGEEKVVKLGIVTYNGHRQD